MDRRANRVVYTSTFGKPFATGVRVGFGLLPEPLLTAALRVKGNHDFGTANFLQQILSQALTNGSYETQVAKLPPLRAQGQGHDASLRGPFSGRRAVGEPDRRLVRLGAAPGQSTHRPEERII